MRSSRRPSAFLSLALVNLTLGLFLSTSSAYAGTYVWSGTDTQGNPLQSPTYSGGTVVFTWSDGTSSSTDYQPGSDGYGNPYDQGFGNKGVCSGTISTVFTWQPDTGKTVDTDPPPASVIVKETCHATAGGVVSPAAYVGGSCDNGLGVKQPSLTQSPSLGPPGTQGNADCQSAQYRVMKAGPTVTLTCSPVAEADGQINSVKVFYTAAIYPVTISLFGTTKDSNNGDNILVGQNCTAILSSTGRPSELTLGDPAWAIPGNVYTSFNIGPNQNTGDATYWNAGDGPPQIQPFFYWGDNGLLSGAAPLTILVSAPLNYTANGISVQIGDVFASKKINVWTPDEYDTPVSSGSGTFQANPEFGNVGLENGNITSNANNTLGFSFEAAVGTPELFTFNNTTYGSWAWLQLVQTNETQGSNGLQMSIPQLDSSFPYNLTGAKNGVPGLPQTANSTPNKIKYGVFADSPSIPYYDDYQIAVAFTDSFSLYVMFQPPDAGRGTNWVPLYLYQWSFNGNISRPNIFSAWSPNPPGSLTFLGGHPHPDYPLWSDKFAP